MSGHDAILVAEDDSDDAFFLERAFAEAQVNVPIRFVRTGEEAINYLKGKPPFQDRNLNPLPKLLVLDLKMPFLTGFDVLEWLQSQPGWKRMPAIVLTGSEVPADVRRAYSLGATLYLNKPHRLSELREIMKPVLDNCGLTGGTNEPVLQSRVLQKLRRYLSSRAERLSVGVNDSRPSVFWSAKSA